MHISCPDSPCLHEISMNTGWLGDQAPGYRLSTRTMVQKQLRIKESSRLQPNFATSVFNFLCVVFFSDAEGHTNFGFANEAAMI